MLKALKRFWKYIGAKLNMEFDAAADPKVQLEQAINEAYEQDRRLREQAANVIANQKLVDKQLTDKTEELAKLNANARQAVVMVDEATKAGDTAKAAKYNSTAQTIAARLIAVEAELENLKALALQAAKASDQAKVAVQQNSTAMQKKLAEKQKLLSQLDQAKMQEQLNKTLGSLSATIGEDVPTFDEISRKIDERSAKAAATAELQGESVESAMLEVEQATADVEAEARLEQIRAQMGLATAPAAQPAAAPATGGDAPAADGGEAPTA